MHFIGIGAQKAGTSWMYACLYEHPQVHAPIKEIHFFSRERNYSKGIEWYKDIFKKCSEDQITGEISTSYLYTPQTAERIKQHYPHAKIIVSLRNPIDRAFSQYRNAIKAGEISKDDSFQDALKKMPSIVEQGLYVEQVKRYLELFPREHVLLLVYEDSLKDPARFMEKVYQFLEINIGFEASMLHRTVNTARTPKNVKIDRLMMNIAEGLRKIGLDKFVFFIKKSGLPDLVRKGNTRQEERKLSDEDRAFLVEQFRDDVTELSRMVQRDLSKEWGMG